VGIDLVEMAGELPEIMEKEQMGGVKWRLLKRIGALQDTMSCIERCRKPVIAAIHGYCIGAGLDMVTACDIRLCSRDAVFSLKEAAVGFVADVGVLQRIPLIVGQGIARELAFTAKTIDAARAREILLVNEVFDDQATLMAGAQAMAEAIAANAPLAVEATKNVLNYGVGKSIDDGLRYVASMSTNIVPSKDLMEAFTAFMEKRPPAFTGQ
jgi:enoyl-CoA hydratase